MNKIIEGGVMKMLNISKIPAPISKMLPMSSRDIKALQNKQADIKITISQGTSRLKATANNIAVTIMSNMPKIFTIV